MPFPLTASSTLSPPAEWGQLLEAARAGDDHALGQICQQFREHLLLTADDGLGDDLRAKLGASDVVQQSMLEVHNDFGRFAGKSEQEFRRWITRLVERNLIDAARQFRQTQRRDISRERPIGPNSSGHARVEQSLTSREGTASRIVSRQEEDRELAEAIKRLSPRQRQVVELRHRQGFSFNQIADQLDTSESAARKLWSRAVEQLRHHLTSKHEQRPVQPK